MLFFIQTMYDFRVWKSGSVLMIERKLFNLINVKQIVNPLDQRDSLMIDNNKFAHLRFINRFFNSTLFEDLFECSMNCHCYRVVRFHVKQL